MIDVYPKEVIKVALNGKLEAGLLHLLDRFLDSFFAWICQDAIIGVEDIDNVLLVKYAFVDDGLLESNFLKLGAQVLIPHTSCLFLAVRVLLDLEDVFTPLCPFHLKPLRDLHVYVSVDWSLSEGEDVIKFLGVPAVNQYQN